MYISFRKNHLSLQILKWNKLKRITKQFISIRIWKKKKSSQSYINVYAKLIQNATANLHIIWI